jgi:hypothetical protein
MTTTERCWIALFPAQGLRALDGRLLIRQRGSRASSWTGTATEAEASMAGRRAWIGRPSTQGSRCAFDLHIAPCRHFSRLFLAAWTVFALVSSAAADGQGSSPPISPERVAAAKALRQARQAVTGARAEREAAKRDVDRLGSPRLALNAAPYADPRDSLRIRDEPAEVQPPADDLEVHAAAIPDRIRKLRAERDELLEQLTEEHPRVAALDWRIAELEKRLSGRDAAKQPSDRQSPAPNGSARESRQSQAERIYLQAIARWRAAERALQAAVQSESAARRRWAAADHADKPLAPLLPPSQRPEKPSPPPAETLAEHPMDVPSRSDNPTAEQAPLETRTGAPLDAPESSAPLEPQGEAGPAPDDAEPALGESVPDSRPLPLAPDIAAPYVGAVPSEPARMPAQQKRPMASNPPAARKQVSQRVALCALVGAIVVAALASVRLARSGGDAPFSSHEEIGAALSLPIVGVIPGLPAPPANKSRGPGAAIIRLVCHILAALAVFAVVAYAIGTIEIFKVDAEAIEDLSQAVRQIFVY